MGHGGQLLWTTRTGEDRSWQNIHTPAQIVDSNVSEVFLSSDHTLFLKDNGSLWGMGDNSMDNSDWEKIEAGKISMPQHKLWIVMLLKLQLTTPYGDHHAIMFIKKDGSLGDGRKYLRSLGLEILITDIRPFKFYLRSCSCSHWTFILCDQIRRLTLVNWFKWCWKFRT